MVKNFGHLNEVGANGRPIVWNKGFKALLITAFIAAAAQAIVYALMNSRHSVVNWAHVPIICALLGALPIGSAVLLYFMKQNKSPIATSTIVTALFMAFALSFISALRIDVSFSSLLAALPISFILLSYGNIKFQTSGYSNVTIVPFKDCEKVRSQITNSIVLTDYPDLGEIEAVLIDAHEHVPEWSNFLANCQLSGIPIIAWQDYIETTKGMVHVDDFDVSQIFYSPLQIIYAKTKRILDVIFAIITAPIWITTCILLSLYIAILDGGPPIFVQMRKGVGGKEFAIYKLRTMYKGAEGGATGAMDARIMPGCSVLRQLRLDELPQMLNILKGEMSLIGPRPEAVDLAQLYRSVIPEYDYRTLVLPGLTGWAQVNNGYTSNPDEAKLKLSFDLYYIKHFSLDLDIAILFKTLKTVILRSSVR